MRLSRQLRSSSLRSFQFGWWSLLVFLALGMALEALHGLKAGFYLDSDRELRRTLWRLAHAHGTGLSLLNILLAATLIWSNDPTRAQVRWCRWLMAATVLIPLGFFGAGLFATENISGRPMVLVTAGGGCLLVVVALIAWGISRKDAKSSNSGGN